jgi:hypothetical protein
MSPWVVSVAAAWLAALCAWDRHGSAATSERRDRVMHVVSFH